jgi:hypothetical protein
MHGGKSTGAKTFEGLERIRQAKWKHGRRSAQAIAEHKEFRQLLRSAKKLLFLIWKERGSLTPGELSVKLNELRQLGDNLLYAVENFKFLSVRDAISNYKCFLMELHTFHAYIVFVISQLVSKGDDES